MPEQAGLLRVADVARLLNIGRRTVYTIPFLWERVIYLAPRMPRWEPADVELYKQIKRGRAA